MVWDKCNERDMYSILEKDRRKENNFTGRRHDTDTPRRCISVETNKERGAFQGENSQCLMQELKTMQQSHCRHLGRLRLWSGGQGDEDRKGGKMICMDLCIRPFCEGGKLFSW